MKKIFIVLAAVFIMGINFLYPITANAAITSLPQNTTTHLYDDWTEDAIKSETYYYIAFDTYNTSTNKYYTWWFSWLKTKNEVAEGFYYDGDVLYCPLPSGNGVRHYSVRTSYDGSYTSRSSYDLNGDVVFIFDFANMTYQYQRSNGNTDRAETIINWETNYTPPSPIDIDITFNPAMTGNVSRSYTSGGIEYTSNKFSMTIENNGENAQFAMFIVNHGDDITIPAMSWNTSDLYNGNPVFVYVKDEWIIDDLTMNASSQSYKPSCFHWIGTGQTKTYEIAWSSLDLSANTNYDVVVYAANPSSDVVSLDWNIPYYEVYRSAFTMSNPAVFNAENNETDNYSWNPNVDNKDLFSLSKATQDQWGNFAITGNGNWLGNTNVSSSLNTQQAFGSFFQFFRSILSFLPSQYMTLIFIGLSAIVVIAIIKAVSH